MQTVQAEIDRLEREAAEAEEYAKGLRMEVGMTVCRIEDPRCQKVLILHYLDGKRWDDVAKEIRYSVPRAHQLHDLGMKELNEILAA